MNRNGGAEREGQTCETCRNYLRHYVKDGERFVPIFCGHCRRGEGQDRVLHKLPDERGCAYWQPVLSENPDRSAEVRWAVREISRQLRILETLVDGAGET